MALYSKAKFWIALIAILSFIFSANPAFADYVAFQNTIAPGCNTADGTCMMPGISGDTTRFMVSYTATSTVQNMDRVDIAICRTGGSGTGYIDLQVRQSGTSTGLIIASSSVAVSGNVWSAQCNLSPGAGAGNATTTIFSLNTPIDFISGVALSFEFRLRNVDGADTFKVTAFPGSANEYYYTYSTPSTDCGFSGTSACSMFIKTWATGDVPIQPGELGDYGTTTSGITCSTFDVGCYISSSLTYLFYPTYTIQIFSETPTLASTTPFNYLYETGYLWDDIFGGNATGTQTLTLSFSPMGMSTTTITTGTLEQNTYEHAFFDTIRSWIEVLLYLSFAFGMFRIVTGLIGWTHLTDANTGTRVKNVTQGVYNRFKL